jgi:hypothetical protein
LEAQFGLVSKDICLTKKMKLIMKNVYLTLALAATLGLVSCGGGQSQEAPATEEVVEEAAIESATVTETTEVEAVESVEEAPAADELQVQE